MRLKLPDEVYQIIQKFSKAGYEIYVVGGAVRDLLMGKVSNDWDFTTNATPGEIQKALGEESFHKGYGTVGYPAKMKDMKPHEITTYREEHGYSDKRRPDRVTWGRSLEEDLARRDFTINAMAIEVKDKSGEYSLIDPYDGQKDLEKKLIRAVREAHERFSEDALRMMRAIRIASQLGFDIEPKTQEAIKANATLINRIAKERVRDELMKILGSPHPYEGVMQLRRSGLMEIILPELEKTFGVEQKSPQRHHIYDVGTHSVMALKSCRSTDPIVRFATLIHDIGKPATYKKLSTGVITFYNHEVVGAGIAKRIAERLRLSKKDTEKLVRLVRWHQFSVTHEQTDSAIRRFIRNLGKEYVEDMLILRTADRLGGGAKETSWRLEEFKRRLIEVQKQPFSIQDLKINGKDIMKELDMKPGPKVGEILNKLFEEVTEKKVPNERKALLSRLNLLHRP